jgi:ribosomal-protein-serine acetyltransferase
MTTSFPIVINPHIQLTLLNLEHAEEFFALIEKNRPYLRKCLGWLDNIQKVENLQRFIQAAINDYPDKKSLRAWIKYDEKIMGIIHLVEIDWSNRKAMIGYWIDENSAGKGLATKACEALTQFAFNEWNLNRIEVRCAPDNVASQMIPKKLGFKEEGILRSNEWLYDHFVDHIVYSKLANETN